MCVCLFQRIVQQPAAKQYLYLSVVCLLNFKDHHLVLLTDAVTDLFTAPILVELVLTDS